MPTYIFTHQGMWPVGACSVVTADSALAAEAKVEEMLKRHGHIPPPFFIELKWESGQPDKIILDGGY